jgi:hypothetical protein
MQLLNFSLGNDNISVITDGSYLDLHNNFDLAGYDYNVVNNSLQITFKKSLGEWAKKDVFGNLKFKFSKVSLIKINGEGLLNNLNDNNCLDIIGFSSPDLKDDMESFPGNNEFKSENDMIFIFVTGHSIKIHSDSVILEVK